MASIQGDPHLSRFSQTFPDSHQVLIQLIVPQMALALIHIRLIIHPGIVRHQGLVQAIRLIPVQILHLLTMTGEMNPNPIAGLRTPHQAVQFRGNPLIRSRLIGTHPDILKGIFPETAA